MSIKSKKTVKGGIGKLGRATLIAAVATTPMAGTVPRVYADIPQPPAITIQAEKQFKDLVDSYSRKAISWAIQKNIVSGYPDGTFKPRSNVSEAEWLAMMAKYYQEDIKSEGKVSGEHWANKIYEVMEKHKLPVKGTSDIKARDTATKRKDLAKIVAASHGFNLSYEQAIEYMYENDFSSGNDPNKKTYETYGAEENLQRQQAVMFLMKIDSKVKERGGVVFRGKFYKIADGKIVGIPDGGIDFTREDIKTPQNFTVDDFGIIVERDFTLALEKEFFKSIKVKGNKITGKMPKAPQGKDGHEFVMAGSIYVDYSNGETQGLAGTSPRDINRMIEGQTFEFTMKEDISKIKEISIAIEVQNKESGFKNGSSWMDYITKEEENY